MSKGKTKFDARGTLNALLGPDGARELTQRDQLLMVELSRLSPTPHQPRTTFTPESLAELTQSIRENGVLQPILVRPAASGYEIVAGERRWRAAGMAGLQVIPAYVRELDDQTAAAASAVENLLREDLNPLEEVEAKRRIAALALGVDDDEVMPRLRRLLDHPEEDPEGIAELNHAFGRLGSEKWESFIRNKGRLLNIPDDVKEALQGGLDYRKALLIGAVENASERAELLRRAQEGATVRQLRDHGRGKPSEREALWRSVSQALSQRRRLSVISEARQKKIDRILQQLQELLSEDATTRP